MNSFGEIVFFLSPFHDCFNQQDGEEACSGHGERLPIDERGNRQVCVCEPGWAGHNCQYPFRPCKDAVVDFGNGTVKVWKASAFGGRFCVNGGQCYRGPGSDFTIGIQERRCSCPMGWRGWSCFAKWTKVTVQFKSITLQNDQFDVAAAMAAALSLHDSL